MSRVLTGTVVSTKMQKTIVVAVKRSKTHPLYRKAYVITKRFQAHDEESTAKLGDTVQIRETRPMSKHKKFALDKVLDTAEATK